MLDGIVALAKEVIVLPSGDCPYEIERSSKLYPFFKNAIGAIDGTHIEALVPTADVPCYHNRKGQITLNVIVACTFSMYFCFVLSGWEGSAHDRRVYKDALTKRFIVPKAKYYLGDAGYPLSDKCLTPYRGVRYHLREQYQTRNK